MHHLAGVVPAADRQALLHWLASCSVRFLSARLWRVGEHWSIPQRTLADDFLLLLINGTLEATIAGRRWPMAPGDISVIPAHTEHAVRRASSTWVDVFAVHVLTSDPRGRHVLSGCKPNVLSLPEPARWIDDLTVAAGLMDDAPIAGSAYAEPVSRLLLAELIRCGLRLPPAHSDDAVIDAVLSRIHADPGAAHTIASLAHQTGLGQARFRVRFRAATGSAPKPYLDRIRLAYAATLLTTAPLGERRPAIATIASKTGFPTTRHFLARFKAAFGVCPSAYRRGDRP